MDVEFLIKEAVCRYREKRTVERISRGVLIDKRPDLVLWICHYPLPSLSGIQCPVITRGIICPHNGPYGNN
ncbi:MAG: hypothetical protein HZA07_01035 [Nitrospirae bacterium]|nr:hypothetical protein [Nitrospirota bacterium]